MQRFARRRRIPLDVPWSQLTPDHRRSVLEGDEDFQGVVGFFRWLETRKYKVQVRVFLSDTAGTGRAPTANGARLRREACRSRSAG
jgi:excinuclease ABC subunit A